MSTATSTDIAVDIAVDSTYSKHDPLIPGFSGLAGILHQFRGVNGCYSNHRHLDATSLKANFLEANYKCKVTCITQGHPTNHFGKISVRM